ncbi:hypothetical protein GSY71_02155 [Pusillimonas sp. TS35]|uniref:hypothetical protein n=1 Tax=Paracandidimonas lactea TaxID=2895524 RepID=UPI00136ECB90|nr:hypothetical protein [Paracandidimonas lactea]MYN11956.1 hypothetical protein [Pusillimonas sp. TS35]
MSAELAIPALERTLVLGFKSLVWLNGLGIAAITLCSAGVVQLDIATIWLRFPLALFLSGLALGLLGLLWSYPLQSSLAARLASGRRPKLYWVPMLCTTLAYLLSLVMFAGGCWFFQLLLESLQTY